MAALTASAAAPPARRWARTMRSSARRPGGPPGRTRARSRPRRLPRRRSARPPAPLRGSGRGSHASVPRPYGVARDRVPCAIWPGARRRVNPPLTNAGLTSRHTARRYRRPCSRSCSCRRGPWCCCASRGTQPCWRCSSPARPIICSTARRPAVEPPGHMSVERRAAERAHSKSTAARNKASPTASTLRPADAKASARNRARRRRGSRASIAAATTASAVGARPCSIRVIRRLIPLAPAAAACSRGPTRRARSGTGPPPPRPPAPRPTP